MQKRKISAVLVCIVVYVLVLTACADMNTSRAMPEVHVKRNLTAELPVVYDISTVDADYQDLVSVFDYSIDSDVSTIAEYSSAIVRGVVQEVTFTSYEGDAFTAVTFYVDECYKGDLKQGDLITILQMGGYIPLQDHMDYYQDEYLYESLSNEEVANSILHESHEGDGEPQVGDHNIYFLDSPIAGSSLPAEAYQRTRGASSLFRVESDGETVSRKNSDVYAGSETVKPIISLFPPNGEEAYGNEVFSLQEIIGIASAS